MPIPEKYEGSDQCAVMANEVIEWASTIGDAAPGPVRAKYLVLARAIASGDIEAACAHAEFLDKKEIEAGLPQGEWLACVFELFELAKPDTDEAEVA